MLKVTEIHLPAGWTDEHQRLLVKYLRLPRAITRDEWGQALAAFDLLHAGRVRCGRRRLTFQAFYAQTIDAIHATPFVEVLLGSADVEAHGSRLLTEHWRQIAASLAEHGVTGETLEARALVVYCSYWWRSFIRGYIREVSIFRDLEQAGVRFDAHDLRDPVQRRSAYDLRVLDKRGDVKTSTSFIQTARAFPLRCDFYIVRLWDDARRRWYDLVLMKPETWQVLDGEPMPCTWDNVVTVLPAVAQLEVRGETLVVVPYAEWKRRVLTKQAG